MIAAHKSEWPAGTGQNVKLNTNDASLALAEKISNTEPYLIARLALAGHAVNKGTDGGYLVCKFGLARYCKDFVELQAFARIVGVK